MQAKFEYILTLAKQFLHKKSVNVAAFAARYRIDKRTVRRYIEDMQEIGFNIVETQSGTFEYFPNDGQARPCKRKLTDEELSLVNDVVSFFSVSDSIRTAVSGQLEELFDSAGLFALAEGEICFRSLLTIRESVRSRKRVILRLRPGYGYARPEFRAEPYGIDTSGRYVSVHDLDNGGNRVLSLTSVIGAELLDENWEMQCRHNNLFVDSFGQTGKSLSHVRISMSDRARQFFAAWFPDCLAEGSSSADFMVSDYKAVINYILAFPNEVRIRHVHDIVFE